MIVYAESSAVLAWLLGDPAEAAVRIALDRAERVVTSALTSVECSRALTRAQHLGRVNATEELAARQLLDQAERSWDVHGLTERVLLRAKSPLPGDPVRTQDALHVVTAMLFREALGDIAVLSLDDRVRTCATGVGLLVVPAETS